MCMFSQPKYPTPPSPTASPAPVSAAPMKQLEEQKSAKRLAGSAIYGQNTAGLMGTRQTGGMGIATAANTQRPTLMGG